MPSKQARVWPAYLMRRRPFLVHLIFAYEKSWKSKAANIFQRSIFLNCSSAKLCGYQIPLLYDRVTCASLSEVMLRYLDCTVKMVRAFHCRKCNVNVTHTSSCHPHPV